MKIKVTASDIRCGKRYEAFACPIAIAVSRAMGAKAFIGRFITVGNRSWHSSDQVRDFMQKFDNGDTVLPFEFDLNDK